MSGIIQARSHCPAGFEAIVREVPPTPPPPGIFALQRALTSSAQELVTFPNHLSGGRLIVGGFILPAH